MSEELKSNENVGAPQPDALAQIASVDPSPAVGGMHPFTPAMLSRLKKQRQLLSELEHALKNHEFCFFLQPKCNSMTRAIVGMEALVRWNHPTRGCVPPSEFMPLLESTGLVTQLDQYIWESVCKTLHKWQESGSNLVPVSVNVSVVDIVNLDVPQIFSNLVEKYQLEPKLLLAEITETMLAENASLVENTIQGLHRKGFSVMMDDFGRKIKRKDLQQDHDTRKGPGPDRKTDRARFRDPDRQQADLRDTDRPCRRSSLQEPGGLCDDCKDPGPCGKDCRRQLYRRIFRSCIQGHDNS